MQTLANACVVPSHSAESVDSWQAPGTKQRRWLQLYSRLLESPGAIRDPWQRGGTYYVSEQTLTADNAAVVVECGKEEPARAVETIVTISEAGRAPKNDAAIFALALLASQPDNAEARRLALAAMPRVCRTATHLFQFVANCKELRGWGRGLREAVAAWYNAKPAD